MEIPHSTFCENNTTSLDGELITIFQHLKECKIDLELVNFDRKNGVNLLISRIKDQNPYDGNLNSIRLLY